MFLKSAWKGAIKHVREGTVAEIMTQPCQLDTENIFVGIGQKWKHKNGGSACMYIYVKCSGSTKKRGSVRMYIYVICSGSMKMEEARVCTFMSYVADARKWRKRVYVHLCHL